MMKARFGEIFAIAQYSIFTPSPDGVGGTIEVEPRFWCCADDAIMVEYIRENDEVRTLDSWKDENEMMARLGIIGNGKNEYGEREERLFKITLWRGISPHYNEIASALITADFPQGIILNVMRSQDVK